MGTLTADSARLPEYCEHKLPTSCRLTSIPQCCACADERAHAASYSTYIDGVGFVPRGTRWQRYCWFCKEFWEQRVNVSGLRPGQTRIPEVPNQTEFLEQWYEFYQGYRLVTKEDGSQERVAVLGEDFRDVSPGYLPRTLEELRTGRHQEQAVQSMQQNTTESGEQVGPSIEDTLGQMFEDAAAEDEQAQQPAPSVPREVAPVNPTPATVHNNIHAQSMNPAGPRNREYQVRRVTALRRELNRMRTGIERVISGLRDLGEEVPDHTETTDRLAALNSALQSLSSVPLQPRSADGSNNVDAAAASSGAQSSERTLANMQTRIDEARTQAEQARQAREQASSELQLAEERHRERQERLQQLQREQRTTENYMRIFGTREEMLAMGDNYESPIGGMFSRAEARFRAAEEVRVEERTLREILAAEAARGGEEETRRLLELEEPQRDIWSVPLRPVSQLGSADQLVNHDDRSSGVRSGENNDQDVHNEELSPSPDSNTSDERMLQEYYALIREQDREDQRSARGTDERTPAQLVSALEEWAAINTPSRDFFSHHPNASVVNSVLTRRAAINNRDRNAAEAAENRSRPSDTEVSGSNQPLVPVFDADIWWNQDAEHIIRALTTDENLRRDLDMRIQDASVLLTYFINDMVSEVDRTTIDGLLRNPTVIWRTNLPIDWLGRRKEQRNEAYVAEDLLFSGELVEPGSWMELYNSCMRLEMFAQAYQMSGSVRRRAQNLSPPERLQLLYRLQAGERRDEDRAILQEMLAETTLETLAMQVFSTTLTTNSQGDATRAEERHMIDNERHLRASVGDHSRSELDARRRETAQAFALAAGRQAMQTGPHRLIQRAVSDAERFPTAVAENQDSVAGTRAAIRRLQDNNFLGQPPRIYRQLTLRDYLDTEEEGSESRGLDALNTDRPEPKPDEELKVQMECKICYTQLAEVACLPCGHLVMCKWCSDQHSPCMQHDRTRPRRFAACPVCRKGIKQKVRIYRA